MAVADRKEHGGAPERTAMKKLVCLLTALVLTLSLCTAAVAEQTARDDLIDRIITTAKTLYDKANGRLQRAEYAGDIYVCKNFTVYLFRQNRDAFRMAEASGVSIAIDSAAVPVADPQRRLACLTWGDDYELLFTLPPDAVVDVAATRIGTVEPRGFAPLFLDGDPLVNPDGLGYTHK